MNQKSVLLAAGVILAVAVVIGLSVGGETSGGEGVAFGDVTVSGAALPPLPDGGTDPALGMSAPTVRGHTGQAGTAVVGGASAQPTAVFFLAHWCPHCRAEVPRIVELAGSGAFDGVNLVAVATGSNPDAPNFPPSAWLDDEEWPGTVVYDDEAAAAATAYGVGGFPFVVYLDRDGEVVARVSGEQGADALRDQLRLLTD